ncbi:MAG: tyrosine--tRNA ligase [Parcubacteria group bacterium]
MKSSKNPNNISSLFSRGVEEVIDKDHLLNALESGRELRVKFGIDPTSPHIHLGRAIPLRKLRAFQELGHKVVLIIGDFTAQIGDPSDKLAKRPMLAREEIKKYLKDYKKQLGKIVDLKHAEFHFNSKWLSRLGFQEISELAENFSVGQMLERRNFRDRFERHEEISLREFMYPLMQGYDSVATKADVEIGGSDQLFNLLAGRVIQPRYGQEPQDIMTFEMLEGTDGRKMSSSWGNVIAIDDEPNDMFGKVMSLKDELISRYFLLCTDVPEDEIEKIGSESPRDAKAKLAEEIVSIYYGESIAEKAAEEFDKVHRDKELPTELEEATHTPADATTLIADVFGLSRSEARRLIEQGAVEADGNKLTDPQKEINFTEEGIVFKAGKHKFIRIKIKRK